MYDRQKINITTLLAASLINKELLCIKNKKMTDNLIESAKEMRKQFTKNELQIALINTK